MKTITEIDGFKIQKAIELKNEKFPRPKKPASKKPNRHKGKKPNQGKSAAPKKSAGANVDSSESSNQAVEIQVETTADATVTRVEVTETTVDTSVTPVDAAVETADEAQTDNVQVTEAQTDNAQVTEAQTDGAETPAVSAETKEEKAAEPEWVPPTLDQLKELLAEPLKLEGEKLELFIGVIEKCRKVRDLKRVVVVEINEKEKPPKNSIELNGKYLIVEYFPSLNPPGKPKGKFAKGKGKKGGKGRFDRNKKRSRRPGQDGAAGNERNNSRPRPQKSTAPAGAYVL